jgi:hypothetical protein
MRRLDEVMAAGRQDKHSMSSILTYSAAKWAEISSRLRASTDSAAEGEASRDGAQQEQLAL